MRTTRNYANLLYLDFENFILSSGINVTHLINTWNQNVLKNIAKSTNEIKELKTQFNNDLIELAEEHGNENACIIEAEQNFQYHSLMAGTKISVCARDTFLKYLHDSFIQLLNRRQSEFGGLMYMEHVYLGYSNQLTKNNVILSFFNNYHNDRHNLFHETVLSDWENTVEMFSEEADRIIKQSSLCTQDAFGYFLYETDNIMYNIQICLNQ